MYPSPNVNLKEQRNRYKRLVDSCNPEGQRSAYGKTTRQRERHFLKLLNIETGFGHRILECKEEEEVEVIYCYDDDKIKWNWLGGEYSRHARMRDEYKCLFEILKKETTLERWT